MVTRQYIVPGNPPFYINDTDAGKEYIVPGGVYVNETVTAGGSSVGTIALNIAVAGVGRGAAASVGTVAMDIALAGVGRAGLSSVGTIGMDIAVAGVGATGSVVSGVGTIALDIAISGVGRAVATSVGTVGIDIAVAGVGASSGLLFEDGHDGDYHKRRKKLFDEEIQRVARNRDKIIAAYESIVEGKPDEAEELTAGFEVIDKETKNKVQVFGPKIDFDRFVKDLDRVERLWELYLEMEDEDLMVLL